MATRAPLSEVLSTEITQPTNATVFIVSDQGTEGKLSVANAITLLATTGDKGDPGIPGYWGSVGYVGSTGTQGVQGIPGFTGSTGTQGNIGWTGSRGTTGTTGFVGSQGLPGVGYDGSRGFVGSTGYTGSTGTTGYTGSEGERFFTATNVGGGIAGAIPIQKSSSSTAFIAPGNNGNLLRYNTVTSTATWISTSTLTVGYATNSDKEYITSLTSAEVTPTKYLTMVSGVAGYYDVGAISDISYHTNNKTLTSPAMTITNTTTSLSALTGALVVKGGVGVAGDLQVGGTITANKLVIQFTTITSVSVTTDDVTTINNTTQATSSSTGALVVAGGVGIARDLRVGGTIYGIVSGGISIATNLAGGTAGQMPYQSAPSTTVFLGAGTSGNLLVSNGASAVGPVFRSTSSISVGAAVNLIGGIPWALPYQSAANTTLFIAPGAADTVLTSNGTSLSWQPSPTSARANTATNIANGGPGQLLYQSAPGVTAFAATGTIGQILLSNGTNAGGPVFTNTSSIKVNGSVTSDNLGGGLQGYIPIQSAAGQTRFIATGNVGQVLQMATGNTATWVDLSAVGAGTSNTATNIAGGGPGRIVYQVGSGQTGFASSGTQGSVLVSSGGQYGTPVFQNTLTLTSSLSSTGTSTGALQVVGGVGFGGDLNVGGNINSLKEITAYYGTPSDIRLKTNITPIDNGLAKVITLSGITYNLKTNEAHKEAGIIAQELLKVLPEVVIERDDGFLTVKYERIIPLLIEAIKDLSNEIEILKKRMP